jgi:hypothetical protein
MVKISEKGGLMGVRLMLLSTEILGARMIRGGRRWGICRGMLCKLLGMLGARGRGRLLMMGGLMFLGILLLRYGDVEVFGMVGFIGDLMMWKEVRWGLG